MRKNTGSLVASLAAWLAALTAVGGCSRARHDDSSFEFTSTAPPAPPAPLATAVPTVSNEEAAARALAAPAGTGTPAVDVDGEATCSHQAGTDYGACREHCDADGRACRRACLQRFANSEAACHPRGGTPIPYVDLYDWGQLPPRGQVSRALEDAVIERTKKCVALDTGRDLPNLVISAGASAEGLLQEVTAVRRDADDPGIEGCFERGLYGAVLPRSASSYGFLSYVVATGVAVRVATATAAPQPASNASPRSQGVTSYRSGLSETARAEREDQERTARNARASSKSEFIAHTLGQIGNAVGAMVEEEKRAGRWQDATPEHCEIARRNLEFARSERMAEDMPELRQDPNYAQHQQELINVAEDAVRRACQ